MKKQIMWFATIVSIVLTSLSAMAYVTFEFPGWATLEQKSKNIIVARCRATPDPYAVKNGGVEADLRGLIESEMEIVSVLKGATNSGTIHVRSEYWPRQGEYYLIFSTYNYGVYQAFESYRIVPLGTRFFPDNLSGKSLDEQIKMLLNHRLEDLTRKIESELQEKERLEKGLHD